MSIDASELCEIRVPTYRRPKLLERALESVVAQTYRNWRCIVFDDCPNGSARSVIDSFRDERLNYSHNSKRLGGIGNIDQAFARVPLLGGKYAFVLEDDNFLLPNHIENSIGILTKHKTKVAFCNQVFEILDVAGEPASETLNRMYEPGIHQPDDLLPALLFSYGFSNGAAFWHTDCQSDFQIGALTALPEIQESLRLFRLSEAVFVSLAPTSVWRPRQHQTPPQTRKLSRTRILRFLPNKIRQFIELKERTECRSMVIKRLGVTRVQSFICNNRIPDFAQQKQIRVSKIETALLLCGYNMKLTSRHRLNRLGWLLAGLLLRRSLPSRLKLERWMRDERCKKERALS
jgi:glycosyltransferase involved in cell wall biosynthesis